MGVLASLFGRRYEVDGSHPADLAIINAKVAEAEALGVKKYLIQGASCVSPTQWHYLRKPLLESVSNIFGGVNHVVTQKREFGAVAP